MLRLLLQLNVAFLSNLMILNYFRDKKKNNAALLLFRH